MRARAWSASLATSQARIDAEANDAAAWDQREHRVGHRARGRGAATAQGANARPRADARAGRRQRRSGTCRDPDAPGVAWPLVGWRSSARLSTPPGASKACFVMAIRLEGGVGGHRFGGSAIVASRHVLTTASVAIVNRGAGSLRLPGHGSALMGARGCAAGSSGRTRPRLPPRDQALESATAGAHGFADHPCRSRARDVVMDATATKKLTGPNVPARPADFVVQGWAARSLLGGHDELIGRRVHVECVRTRRVVAVRDGRVAGGTRKRPAPARGKLCGPRS